MSVERLPLTRDQQKLVESHLHVVRKIAGRCARKTRLASFDDLVQIGRLGLMEAAQTFDASFQVAFEGFAWARIEGAMKNALNRERNHVRVLVAGAQVAGLAQGETVRDTSDALNDTDADTWSRIDAENQGMLAALAAGFVGSLALLNAEERLAAEREYRVAIAALDEAIETLPERDRQIVKLHYFERLDLQEVASRTKIAYGSLRRYHHDAMNRLGLRLRQRGVAATPPLL